MSKKIIEIISVILYNNYIKTLIISILIAFNIVFILFGSYGLFKNHEIPYSFISICLFILAIFFILLIEYFKHKMKHLLCSFFFSFVLSCIFTFLVMSILEGFKMLIYGTFWKIGITFDLSILFISLGMIFGVILYTIIQYNFLFDR